MTDENKHICNEDGWSCTTGIHIKDCVAINNTQCSLSFTIGNIKAPFNPEDPAFKGFKAWYKLSEEAAKDEWVNDVPDSAKMAWAEQVAKDAMRRKK